MPSVVKLDIDFADDGSSSESETEMDALQKALHDFSKSKVRPKHANNMIRALQEINDTSISINEDDFNGNTILLNSKNKREFVSYYTKNDESELAASCWIYYFETTDNAGRKFFIKKFSYLKDPKRAAAATLTKILAEIFYQKKAYSLLGLKKSLQKRSEFNFKVPEIFSYGHIIPRYVSNREAYYIKMEYIDRTEYLTLTTIINYYPFYLTTPASKKNLGDTSAAQLCESIVSTLRYLNNILIAHFIYHNDLQNPDNVLINPTTKTMVVIDFGEASEKRGTGGKVYKGVIPDCETIYDDFVKSGLSKSVTSSSQNAEGVRSKTKKCKTKKCKTKKCKTKNCKQ